MWEHLVDPHVGIIRAVEELPVDDDEPDFFHYLSKACDTSAFTALRNFGNNGGVSTDRYTAIAKSVGEGVERYCSAIFRGEDLIYERYRALDGEAVAPWEFALYHPDQFAWPRFHYEPFTIDTPVAWTSGVSLVSGEPRLVPAAMVYVPYRHRRDGSDACVVQPISTGLACDCSFDAAALNGLCEVVERDAFTITWQAQVSWPRVEHDNLSDCVRDLLARFATANLDVEIVNITTDVSCPTIMTIALGHTATSPAIAVAAATHPSPEIALVKCLEELAHTRKFARQLMEYTPPLPVQVEESHPQVTEQAHHLRFYCPQESKAYAWFAWSAHERVDFADLQTCPGDTPGEQLTALVDRVAARDLDVIALDLTTPDIAALGLSVVRVVVPGMHPLFMGHKNRALGGHRLYTVPQLFGHRGLQPGEADNPYPHPFP